VPDFFIAALKVSKSVLASHTSNAAVTKRRAHSAADTVVENARGRNAGEGRTIPD
jgi:hypothetical protein